MPVRLPLQHALLRWQANSACQEFIPGMFTSQRADIEAAKLYDDFVESFGGDDAPAKKQSFVTGGTIEPGSRPGAGTPSADTRITIHKHGLHFSGLHMHC